MLTAEERQRIEEEERKRVAEEKYRAEVRAQLKEPTLTVGKKPTSVWKIGAGIVCAVFLIIIANNMLSSNRGSANSGGGLPTPFAPRFLPVSQKVLNGQIIVKSGGFVQYRIQITPDMRAPRLSGKFNASGGSGNDIEVVLATEDEFTNWINGHEARVYYSGGKKTTDSFNVRLNPGTYVLAFNNKFSLLTDKMVFGEVNLDYSRAE